MSDDDYYADSPYDEFEEMLYDADPAPNLADDLAQHAAYSPVWQDDPIGELEQYHSDWEYYSDDYFDDDPAILKINPIDGSTGWKRATPKTPARRGKKRKLEETFDTLDSIENKSLRSTIQGTVWAKNTSPNTKVFRQGQQEKVALLTDWRERFRVEGNESRRKGQLNRDESWANELGLEDMGLKNVGDSKDTDQDVDSGDDNACDEDDLDMETFETEFKDSSLQGESDLQASSDLSTPEKQPLSKPAQGNPPDLESSRTLKNERTSNSNGQPSHKRSRTSSLGAGHQDEQQRKVKASGPMSNNVKQPADSAISPGLETLEAVGKETNYFNRASMDVDENRNIPRQTRAKRKLSPSTEEISSPTRSTTSNRAKRVASKKLGSVNSTIPTEVSPASNTRAAKARKK